MRPPRPWILVILDPETKNLTLLGYHRESEALEAMEEALGCDPTDEECVDGDGNWLWPADNPDSHWLQIIHIEFPVQ